MDMPVNVPVDDPKADTEWNDILRKHGVIPEKPPSPTPLIEEAIHEGRRLAHENRLEWKGLDELDELEDEEDEEFLEKYRKQRLAEFAAITTASVHGQVYPLQKPDYFRDVTEASKTCFVLVHLTSSLQTNIESRVLTELWREMARKFGEVKFCEIKGNLCIEGYPDKNCPTILVYHNEEIVRQVVTLKQFHGVQTTMEDLERLLIDVGAVKASDYRVVKGQQEQPKPKEDADNDDDVDDDWD